MKILYFAVHQILEDDEVRLFQSMGHDVCLLGDSGPTGAVQNYRERIPFNAVELEFYASFAALGGQFTYCGNPKDFVIPKDFVAQFDVVIVMHDPGFLREHWAALSTRPVVWRTIGQAIEQLEPYMKDLRDDGLRIVRYSPKEAEAPGHLGADATIRFFKNKATLGSWTGSSRTALSFSNAFAQRYPADAADYVTIAAGLPVVLGGIGNEALPGAIGMVPFDRQASMYQQAGAYLYAHGLEVPYTLNFIEAWYTGVPMVIHAPYDRRGRYFEIDELITHGEDGIICRSPEEAHKAIDMLLNDIPLAQALSSRAQEKAGTLFSVELAKRQWGDFLRTLVA